MKPMEFIHLADVIYDTGTYRGSRKVIYRNAVVEHGVPEQVYVQDAMICLDYGDKFLVIGCDGENMIDVTFSRIRKEEQPRDDSVR